MRIAGQQLDGEAPAVAHADERRARRQRQPLGDRPRQPARVLGRPEVLGEPALGVEARVLDLAVAVEQHDGGARRRIGGERADEARARLRGPQRVLEAGAHEIEDVTVALGELTLGAAEAGDDHLTTLRADADRDAVLDAGSVEQVAVQLAVGQAARLDGLGEAQRRHAGGRHARGSSG